MDFLHQRQNRSKKSYRYKIIIEYKTTFIFKLLFPTVMNIFNSILEVGASVQFVSLVGRLYYIRTTFFHLSFDLLFFLHLLFYFLHVLQISQVESLYSITNSTKKGTGPGVSIETSQLRNTLKDFILNNILSRLQFGYRPNSQYPRQYFDLGNPTGSCSFVWTSAPPMKQLYFHIHVQLVVWNPSKTYQGNYQVLLFLLSYLSLFNFPNVF